MTVAPSEDTAPPRGIFYRIRVGILLTVLFGVLLGAARDVRQRRARNDWDHTLEVAIVVVRRGPVTDAAIEALGERLPALGERLYRESQRHGVGHTKPFRFQLRGPVDVASPPPQRGEGLVAALTHAHARSRYTDAIDHAAGVDRAAFDARIYVLASPPVSKKRALVEGESDQGGRVGLVNVELVPEMADLASIVVAHELFHTLGATDKYDAEGQTTIPAGLVVPNQQPLFPQGYVDVMARLRPLSATTGELPESLDELGVGPATAHEIGWTKR